MSLDARISDDLAIVARTSRARPVPLEATLARLEPTPRPAPPALAAAPYAARIAAGAAALVGVGALWFSVRVVHDDNTEGLFDQLLHSTKTAQAACVLGFTFVVQLVVGLVVRRSGPRWRTASIALSIAGAMTFLLFWGVMVIALRHHDLMAIGDVVWLDLLVGAAVLSSLGGAIVVALRGVRYARWMPLVGSLLLVMTATVGVRLVGPFDEAVAMRALLTVPATAGLFLVVTGIVLCVHERDGQYAS